MMRRMRVVLRRHDKLIISLTNSSIGNHQHYHHKSTACSHPLASIRIAQPKRMATQARQADRSASRLLERVVEDKARMIEMHAF